MTLSEFAQIARRVVIYAALTAAAYFALVLLWRLATAIYFAIYPPPEPPPTVGFGTLPQLNLRMADGKGTPVYILETPTGQLPEISDRAEVAAMANPVVTLLGEEKARELAAKLDFGGQGTLSADRKTLTFKDTPDQRTLVVNVITQDFQLSTSASQIVKLVKGNAPSPTTATESAKRILTQQLGLLKFGFEAGNQTTSFWTSNGKILQEVGSSSEAHFTEVSFFRTLTDVGSQNHPLLPPNPKRGLIRVGVTTLLSPPILNTISLYFEAAETEIDKTKVETYPIKTPQQAWDEMRAQNKVAYSELTGELDSVTITGISLAYFDDPNYQAYLQPIYVFSGVGKIGRSEGEFITYVSAVSADWVED
ncbi:MAG: hypothetical protein WEC39_01815 [Patescibacteria group bacterium]